MGLSLLELLSAYLPIDRREAMVAGRDLPARARGAVLVADISGFTPLTEALETELGPHLGGEELTRHLNVVYGALIAEVHRFRGSIIGFSGDAITCWFDEQAEGKPSGARAGACGLRLQEAMSRWQVLVTPSGAQHSLAIKVVVTCGPVRRFVVGDPSVQLLDVLSGKLLERAARADTLAARGELIVDEETVRTLGAGAVITAWRDDAASGERFAVLSALEGELALAEPWPAIDVRSLTEEQLGPWLHRAVVERLRSGQGDFLAELRQPVALFLRFGQLDFEGDENVASKLDAYVRWTQGVLEYYGGSLIQLTTGDKGSYLYAAFGAPVAQEDVVERALSAALVLREPPAELDFITRVQIGVSCGRMRTGAYGSERRRTYGVLGDETNVAARLMMKALPGQVLVSDRITAACVTGYVFESLGAIDLKGKKAPTPIFSLCGRAGGPSVRGASRPGRMVPDGTLVGRVDERVALGDALDSLCRGEDVTVLLEGEAGIGKSRLVADLVDRARGRLGPTVRCLLSGADPIEHASSYFACRQVFATLLGVERLTDPDAIRAQVQARLPEVLRPLSPLLSPLLGTNLPETAVSVQLQGKLRASKTPAYLASVFWSLVGIEPVLLVVEDTHWLDSSSWTLLDWIRRGGSAPLLLVLTTRPVASPPHVYQQLRSSASTRFMALDAMSPAEATTLVCHRLGVASLPEPVAALIRDKAEGNPFYAEEMGYALRDRGLIRIEDGECHLQQPLDGLRFPDSVEGVVTSRIDRLAPTEQLTLKVASVIGRVFQLGLLRDVYPVVADRAELPRFLDTLVRLDLTPRESSAQQYAFKHAVTLDVSYNLMLFEQRRNLHAAVANWYERVYADDLTPYYALLAHHHLGSIEGVSRPGAQQLRDAAGALVKAGKQSLERGATPEANDHLRKGLALVDLLPPGRERSALELELRFLYSASLSVALGPTHKDVRREFLRTRQLCVELNETRRLFEAVFGLWYTHLTGAERNGAEEFSRQLLEIATASKVPAQLCLAHQACGAVAVCDGDYLNGLRHMDEVSALATGKDAAGFADALAQARDPLVATYCYRTWASWFSGFPERATREAEMAIELAGAVAHPMSLVQALCFAAQASRYRRDTRSAEAYVRRAHTMAVELGFPYWLGTTSSVFGWLALERDDVEAALVELRGGMAADRAAGIFPPSSIVVLADIIDGLTRLGRFDEAMETVREAESVIATKLTGYGAPEIYRRHGELCQRRGDDAGAEACFERAVATARAHDARSLELRAAMSLHRLRRTQGRSNADALSVIYATFTEGHATRDLEEARALLAEEGR